MMKLQYTCVKDSLFLLRSWNYLSRGTLCRCYHNKPKNDFRKLMVPLENENPLKKLQRRTQERNNKSEDNSANEIFEMAKEADARRDRNPRRGGTASRSSARDDRYSKEKVNEDEDEEMNNYRRDRLGRYVLKPEYVEKKTMTTMKTKGVKLQSGGMSDRVKNTQTFGKGKDKNASYTSERYPVNSDETFDKRERYMKTDKKFMKEGENLLSDVMSHRLKSEKKFQIPTVPLENEDPWKKLQLRAQERNSKSQDNSDNEIFDTENEANEANETRRYGNAKSETTAPHVRHRHLSSNEFRDRGERDNWRIEKNEEDEDDEDEDEDTSNYGRDKQRRTVNLQADGMSDRLKNTQTFRKGKDKNASYKSERYPVNSDETFDKQERFMKKGEHFVSSGMSNRLKNDKDFQNSTVNEAEFEYNHYDDDDADEPLDQLSVKDVKQLNQLKKSTQGTQFAELGIKYEFIKLLQENNITEPTVVQANSIPKLLKKKSSIIESETGSGKTLAFLLPLLQNLNRFPCSNIIIVPTRELATQIYKEVLTYGVKKEWVSRHISGVEEDVDRSLRKTLSQSRILIGTPKKLLEIVEPNLSYFRQVKTIVMDEVDKLLVKNGNAVNSKTWEKLKPTEKLLSMLRFHRKGIQLVATSATVSESLVNSLQDMGFGNNCKMINLIPKEYPHGMIPVNIKHSFTGITESEMPAKVRTIGHFFEYFKEKSIMVFIDRRESVAKVVDEFKDFGLSTRALYKELLLPAPASVAEFMKQFEDGDIQVVVSSEETVRGIDFPFLDSIYLTFVPDLPENYVHLAGRAGRMGQPARVITVIGNLGKPDYIKEKERYKRRLFVLGTTGTTLQISSENQNEISSEK